MITDRLKSALAKEQVAQAVAAPDEMVPEAPRLMTDFTEAEQEGFLIVKTILRQKVAGNRITTATRTVT